MATAAVIGGTGFIGAFFSRFLIEEKGYEKVYVLDVVSPEDVSCKYRRKLLDDLGEKIQFQHCDVRSEITWSPSEEIELVANFAAIHREPGHQDYEYFETNICGARNVCNWVEVLQCHNLIFTSSIAPYGGGDDELSEASLPVPVTAYGASKLVAEEIHRGWFERQPNNRSLIICRPGVVFGPGEGGNVSRLIRAVKGNYFFFCGNDDVRKAGIFVKELCFMLCWFLDAKPKQHTLFNACMHPVPTLGQYVTGINRVLSNQGMVFRIPFTLLLGASYIFELVFRCLRLKNPFSPVRVRKLKLPNNVTPAVAIDNGYLFKYTLESAFVDWKNDAPHEW